MTTKQTAKPRTTPKRPDSNRTTEARQTAILRRAVRRDNRVLGFRA